MQELAQQAWDQRTPLRELLAARQDLTVDLEAIFQPGQATRWVGEIVGRLEGVGPTG